MVKETRKTGRTHHKKSTSSTSTATKGIRFAVSYFSAAFDTSAQYKAGNNIVSPSPQKKQKRTRTSAVTAKPQGVIPEKEGVCLYHLPVDASSGFKCMQSSTPALCSSTSKIVGFGTGGLLGMHAVVGKRPIR
ncbi:hypothetical protein WG66_002303 [Moniliophthora roreri]|nr:hypothetical protein WG66_002303 [Moniliophthora roreri]